MNAVRSEGVREGALLLRGLAPAPVPFAMFISYRVGGRAQRGAALDSPGPDGRFRCGPFELEPLQEQHGDALALSWRLTNVSTGPVLLDGVSLEVTAEAWPLLGDPGGLRIFQHGYQSWTPSGSVAGSARPASPRLRSFALMNHFVDSPLWGRRDGLLSSLFTLLAPEGGGAALLFGFTTQRVGLGELFFRNRGQCSLTARLDYGGLRMDPGCGIQGEQLRVERGEASNLLVAWAGATGRAMEARVPASSPVGWCSWYQYYTRVRAEDLRANTDFLAAHPELGVGLVQLDDGYQPHVGDWLERNDRFAAGLEASARHIRESGFQAGIWTAPFFASARSRLLAEHREWFLHKGGSLVATGFNPEWRARTFALDTSHPGVLDWLGTVFEALVAEGFDYHKIDFLFAGLRHGDRHDPSISPVQAYRLGLETIRRAIGPDRFLLGCGAPVGPSVGFVDAMRVSQDVKEQWDSWLAAWAGRGCGYPAARGALRGNMTRWFMHRSLWINDPDCLLVREHDSRLTEAETETLVSVLGATGGMLFLSDDLPRVAPQRLALAAAVLPPSPLVGHTDCVSSAYPEEMCVEGAGGRRLVLQINWSGRRVQRPLPECAGQGTWYDFWRAREVDQPGPIDAHGVRALVFVPETSAPRIIGDSLHLLALVDGRLSAERGDTGLSIRCEGLARGDGALLLSLPRGVEVVEGALPPGFRLLSQAGQRASISVSCPSPWRAEIPLRRAGSVT
jgi:alpha-galactosidase